LSVPSLSEATFDLVRQTMMAREAVCQTAVALTRPDLLHRLHQIEDQRFTEPARFTQTADAVTVNFDPFAGWSIACAVDDYYLNV
jgi:hypothetical protein